MRILLYQSTKYQEVLSFFLKSSAHHVVGILGKASDLDLLVHRTQPDVAIIDISLPNGTSVIRRMKSVNPGLKILVLTNNATLSLVMECLRDGADGYLLIDKTSLPRLLDYLRDVNEGGIPISSDLIGEVFKDFVERSHISADIRRLTRREYEILSLLVEGASYKTISFTLNIALDTVRSHIKKIYDKLQVNSKSEAVATALRKRMVLSGLDFEVIQSEQKR